MGLNVFAGRFAWVSLPVSVLGRHCQVRSGFYWMNALARCRDMSVVLRSSKPFEAAFHVAEPGFQDYALDEALCV